ncbi:hypothetical protein CGE01nite_16460 [Cellulomonas gelida]|uniref:Helix-turn-helix domain-containing protein n=2 Tax=Cellulomonas gelida TaxID=1712 RepID=A0A4Y3KMM7_9CELL|nr:hypothetical protein CGE01nite_16460 [Cellulomonas gelida]
MGIRRVERDRSRMAYTISEAAELAGTSVSRIQKAIHGSEAATGLPTLRARRLGRRYAILAKDLEAWLESLPEA